MSDDRPPRLSGWCSPTDQYHQDCKSSTCECANDPANHGRNALFTRGLGVPVCDNGSTITDGPAGVRAPVIPGLTDTGDRL